MVTWQSSSRQSSFQSPIWGLGAAQAQMDAIAAALMPLGVSPSGRVQVPSVEIETTADTLVVTAFLPGVDPQAVQVRATQTSLIFSGQRQSGYRTSLLQNFGINYFQQTVPLPERVIDRQVQVAYQQGAIVVTLPRDKGWGQRLVRNWQRLRHSLGHSLKALGQRLLEDR
ncbi:Hsp20/alpha crystallin family protein [Nodosilinea sp. LEGE 06152]|uniref:Hsp20/alpha crystallin family protein n=1 Tax=Nodosilinea sp. LEGE 06152 TaxID=2777966 RepID=UPI001882A716|nr:Hsp20 family protein [Nodosilinea sp. LEGE 06152]MBE9158032.1 Hsp20/alpha crystallin family protein [Nodosilinea sp. LEGE 06152]